MKNKFLSKPIVLSLLFILLGFLFSYFFDGIFSVFKINFDIISIPFVWVISALFVGIIYTTATKEMLSKNQKIKVALYSLSILLALFLGILSFFMELFNKSIVHLLITLLTLILPTLLIIISGICIYPALDLGCKIANQDKIEGIEKSKLKDCLLIILLIVLAVFFDKINDPALNALKPHFLIYMEQRGYIHKIKPVKIEVKHFKDKISTSGIDFITTTNYANLNLGYYYYIPKKIKKNKIQNAPFLIIVPGTNGKGQDIVTQPFKDFAQQKGFVIIAPSFVDDDKNFDNETSYQYPAAWSGKALNKILSDFYTKQHIKSKELYFFGLSAGAQFAERYSLLYPNTVTACFLFAPGGITEPKKKQKTKFVINVGNQDDPDHKKAAADFYNSAKALGIDVKYKEYNIGHKLSNEQITDSITFFKTLKND